MNLFMFFLLSFSLFTPQASMLCCTQETKSSSSRKRIREQTSHCNGIINPQETELHKAISSNDCEKVKDLLDAGTENIYAELYPGYDALAIAVCENNSDMVKLLIEYGARVQTDRSNILILAAGNNNREICYDLLRAHADINTINRIGQSVFSVATKNNYEALLQFLENYRNNHSMPALSEWTATLSIESKE